VLNRAKAGQSIPVKFNLDGPATVSWTPPTATDIVDTNPVVTCDFTGNVFPQGTTTVTCTATDDSNNTATDSFDVTVMGGNLGTSILAQDSPRFVVGNVPPASVDGVEEYAAASTPGLHYDELAHQYVYVWATSKAWVGKSGTLEVKFATGQTQTAMFNFTK
jgi:large repetitive protein